jgi:hypothetical protein
LDVDRRLLGKLRFELVVFHHPFAVGLTQGFVDSVGVVFQNDIVGVA